METGPGCLLVGEFVPDDLAGLFTARSGRNVARAVTIATVLQRLAEGLEPDLVVVCQSVPGEFSAAQVERLIGALPLARWVVAFGPWCESLSRTEALWPAAWCVPARSAVLRVRRELAALRSGREPLPATSSRDEAFAREAAAPLTDALARARVTRARVDAGDRAFEEFVTELLRQSGVTVAGPDNRREPPGSGTPASESPSLTVVAAAQAGDGFVERLRTARRHAPEGLLIAAVDLATPDDLRALTDGGADAVVSQLRLADELVTVLSERGSELQPA